MIQLDVYAVLYSLLGRQRIVLLKETEGERFLPIWIGSHEAEAIATRLQGAGVPRPLTHDLLLNVITDLGATVRYVLVNDLNENTFFARLAIERDEHLAMIDSRPSDAIALAVRANVPIYAEESVLSRAGIVTTRDIRALAPPTDDHLDVFRDFIDTLNLDDSGDQ